MFAKSTDMLSKRKQPCLFPLWCVPNEVIGKLCCVPFFVFMKGSPCMGWTVIASNTLNAIWSITQKGRSGSSHLPLPCIAIRQARKLNAVIRGCGCCMRVGTGLTWRSFWRNKMETFPQHYWTTPWSCCLVTWCHSVWFDGSVSPKTVWAIYYW